MARINLVIVESPTKAKTISQFLGKGYKVVSSYGHVRDLPKSRFGIAIDETAHTFAPEYIVPVKKRKQVSELRKEAGRAAKIILASDEDREGEAIAWHLTQAFQEKPKTKRKTPSPEQKLPPMERIAFHEITRSAIDEALQHPRAIDARLVDAQQARRILDRVVGYKLSPLLWKKIVKGLSAGRVQSVALRLIVDREREIQAFVPQPYYTIEAELAKGKRAFTASLYRMDGKDVKQFDLSREDAERITDELRGTPAFTVVDTKESTKTTHPLPPFTTSTLQQTAWQRLKFPVRMTMSLAQGLYEHGLITYMRTDSTNLSREAIDRMREYIGVHHAAALPDAPQYYRTKSKLAQEAHEAIRPTDAFVTDVAHKAEMTKNHAKLYELVRSRAIASQMKSALHARTAVTLTAGERGQYGFKATGSKCVFEGFLAVYPLNSEGTALPDLTQGETLDARSVESAEHFTEPAPRFTEASLVKTLEAYGIGRPSTYAMIVSTVQQRGYVTKNKSRSFEPTRLGMLVVDILKQHFPQIVDYEFTARMENDLDEVAEGKREWQSVLADFYFDFARLVAEKEKEIPDQREILDERCPECGGNLVRRYTRFGEFVGCSNFPKCTYKINHNVTDVPCPKCNDGKLIKRRSRKGRRQEFYGCTRWPNCDYVSRTLPGEKDGEAKPEKKNRAGTEEDAAG